jgi:tetratricopeptide (TPR) repeat protein
MLETDAASRRHIVFIAAFLLILFGGFALYGTLQRVQKNNPLFGNSIGDPAPVTEDRAAFLAERRVWFKARQSMAKHGKKQDWANAVVAAEKYLRTKEDRTISLLRSEALLRQGNPQAGAEMAKVFQGDERISAGEQALLRGAIRDYQRETQSIVSRVDYTRSSALDANNSAWQAAVGTPDFETLNKAIRLAEYAVAEARQPGAEPNSLPLYTNTLGGLYVRAGRHDDALRLLSESERLQHDIFNAPFFALAYQGRGDHAKAKAWRNRLRKHLDDTYATRDSQENRQELLLLWRETEQMVQETPSNPTNENHYGI